MLNTQNPDKEPEPIPVDDPPLPDKVEPLFPGTPEPEPKHTPEPEPGRSPEPEPIKRIDRI